MKRTFEGLDTLVVERGNARRAGLRSCSATETATLAAARAGTPDVASWAAALGS